MNQPVGQASKSPYDENISRFIVHSSWVRQDSTIKDTAFMPNAKTDPLSTSVTMIGGLTPEEIWRLAQEVAMGMNKRLHGRTDVSVDAISSAGLRLSLTPTFKNPSHADIIDWPNNKAGQKNCAQKLAAKASYLITPNQ